MECPYFSSEHAIRSETYCTSGTYFPKFPAIVPLRAGYMYYAWVKVLNLQNPELLKL